MHAGTTEHADAADTPSVKVDSVRSPKRG